MKPVKSTYRVVVYHPNSMQKIGSFKYKSTAGAKRAAKAYKKDWEVDVKRYQKGKLVEVLNPDDFVEGK